MGSLFSGNLQYLSNGARYNIGPTLLLATKRKSHTRFRLVPKSTTMDDLEWPICTLLQNRCAPFGAHHKNLNEDRPYYQLQKCRPLTLVSCDIKFVRIFAGVLWRGGVKQQWQWGGRKRRFSDILDAMSSVPYEMRPKLLCSIT